MRIAGIDLGDFPLGLAPMEDITDSIFRCICKQKGADVLYTEFVSSEALIRSIDKSKEKMSFLAKERPLAIQIFGHDESSMRQAAEIAADQKPDFLDINWGCPVKKVVSKGAGAGILQDIPKMIRISSSVVRAMEACSLGVTVKTRLGWDEHSKPIVKIAESLQDIGVKGLSVHGRTRAQLYGGEADWTLIGEIKANPRMYIPIFGNGDINSAQKALDYKERYGVDGMLIGRAAIGNPWIFSEIQAALKGEEAPLISPQERFIMAKFHLEQSLISKGDRRASQEIKKHFPSYFRGLPDFKSFKMELMLAKDGASIFEIFSRLAKHYNFV